MLRLSFGCSSSNADTAPSVSLTGIDLRRADAWVRSDRANINNAVAALPGGFAVLNANVRQAFLDWVGKEVHRVGDKDILRCGSANGLVRMAALIDSTRVATALAWGGDIGGAVVLLDSALLSSAQAASSSAVVGAQLAELSIAAIGDGSQPPPPPSSGYVSNLGRAVTIEDLVAVPETPAEAAKISAQVCLSLMHRHLSRPPLPDNLVAVLGGPLKHAAEVADSASHFMPGTRAGLQHGADRE